MSGILNAFVGGSYGFSPVNTVAPVVSGTATFGQTLSTTNGTWTGSPPPTYTYQWQRGVSNIGGATSSTYTLVSADVGNTIRCVVTATNALGSSSANSNSTATVTATVPSAPQSVSATATGGTTATVTWSAPASNGGSAITSYSITWSSGSTTSATTSANITGLTPQTSYTFTVYAINAVGTGSGAASNSITTPAIRGCFTSAGYGGYQTLVIPAGVTSISVGMVGGGGGGYWDGFYGPPPGRRGGGGGGGGVMVNNLPVTAGQTFSIYSSPRVGPNAGFRTAQFYPSCTPCILAAAYGGVYGCNLAGGAGNSGYVNFSTAGSVSIHTGGAGRYGICSAGPGGGAAGISSTTGVVSGGVAYGQPCQSTKGGSGFAGTNGGGGGGAMTYNGFVTGSGGGGTRWPIYGVTSSGAGGTPTCSPWGSSKQSSTASGGVGGSGGDTGGTAYYNPSVGGLSGCGGCFGGGGGGAGVGIPGYCYTAGGGGASMVRVVWPGNTRQFPSTDIP